jgi:hypothetical protein
MLRFKNSIKILKHQKNVNQANTKSRLFFAYERHEALSFPFYFAISPEKLTFAIP